MSTGSTVPALPGVWVAHFTPEGRPFWNHSITKESVWEKPKELKSAAEREVDETTPYKEYETGGRKYWVNSETKETTWEMPKAISDILAKHQSSGAAPGPSHSQQSPPPMNGAMSSPLNAMSGSLVGPPGGIGLPVRPPGVVGGVMGSPGPSSMTNGHNSLGGGLLGQQQIFPPPALQQQQQQQQQQLPPPPPIISAPVQTEFNTKEEAEMAFMSMLSSIQVNPTWTWEQVMRETITLPLYKSLKTLAERKSAFERFVREQVEKENTDREKSLDKWRKEWFKSMDKLGGGFDKEEGIKVWWTWKGNGKKELMKRFSPEVWKGPRNDEEREALFQEFIHTLQTKETARQRELRSKTLEKLGILLKTMSLDFSGSLRWREAQDMIHHTEEWRSDKDLQNLDKLELLNAFEEEVRKTEKDVSDLKAKRLEERRRRHRRAREDFKNFLNQLKEDNVITAGTTWKSVYPLIEPSPAYQGLLGQPGSGPLDLFWDMVDSLDQEAEENMRTIERALIDGQKGDGTGRVTETMTLAEFLAVVGEDEQVKELAEEVIERTFEQLHARAVRQAKEERRRAEKKLRLQIDDLRYAYKKVNDPPVVFDSSFEDNLDRIKDTPEFVALAHDEPSQRLAFEKFIKRQRDKVKEREERDMRVAEEEEAELQRNREDDQTSSSRKDRDRGGDRDRERDRDRSERKSSRRDSDRRRDGSKERERERERERDRERNRDRVGGRDRQRSLSGSIQGLDGDDGGRLSTAPPPPPLTAEDGSEPLPPTGKRDPGASMDEGPSSKKRKTTNEEGTDEVEMGGVHPVEDVEEGEIE